MFSQQADPVVFTLNGNPVYKSEVEYAYKKGNENIQTIIPVDEFIRSYIDFRMNVEEARAEHLDTTANYVRQFGSYRRQMAAPYLRDTVFEDEYARKIYARLLENVEINHLIFPFEKDIIFPADTMEIYKKAVDIRAKVIKNGFSDKVLNAVKNPTGIYMGVEGRNGYLGWIAPFVLSATLEDAVYNLPLKEISLPVRTANGYHIIQVLNKRPAVGSAEIEQVMFRFGEIPATKHQIDSVGKFAREEYANIHSAADFQSLCDAFSKAYKTEEKGCYFGFVGLDSNFPSEFLSAVFSLEKEGDISKPVMSDYGFHIIRLLNKIPVPAYEKIQNQLKSKIRNGSRIHELSKERRKHLISTIGVVTNEDVYARLNNIAVELSPRDSLFLSRIGNENETLVIIDGKKQIPVKEFTRYLDYRQKLLKKETDDIEMLNAVEASPYSLSTDVLREYYNNFLAILASDYLDNTLEDRFSEFRIVMDEFSDGLLLFEVKNKNIWERAKTDEAGLAGYFSQNKSKYTLDRPKYKGMIIYARNEKALKKAEALAKKEKSTDGFIRKVRETVNKDSILVKIEPGSWVQGDNPYVDNKIYGGVEPSPYDGYPYFSVSGKIINAPEDFRDVKAAVELDYQDKLEKDWEAYLKNKYKVDINKSVLETIK